MNFKKIKGAVSVKDAASFYGLKVTRGGMCNCIFHRDCHPSMKVGRNYYCFSCGAKGDSIDFVSGYFSLSKYDAAKKLAKDFQIPLGKCKRKKKKGTPTMSPLQAMLLKEQNYYCQVLSEYAALLKQWKTKYAPTDKDTDWHPLFCEALNRTDYVNYLLDILRDGNLSDRASLIENQGKKVREIEQRIRTINAGTEAPA